VSDRPDQPPNEPADPDEPDFTAMLASLLGGVDNPEMTQALNAMGIDKVDPATMGMIAAQIKAMMSSGPAEPFNLELATDVARKTVAEQGDTIVGDAARREVEQAVRVADLWIDAVTDLTAPTGRAHAWSRAEWVDQTMPMWRQLVEPVAAGVSTASGGRHACPDGKARAGRGSARHTRPSSGPGSPRAHGPDGADAGADKRIDVRRSGGSGRGRARR
jgi:hypothetical protein